jgi:serine/threonine protein kinase
MSHLNPTEPSSHLQPGQILADRYAIRQLLGQGPSRQTLLARDLQAQTLIVIKQLTFQPSWQLVNAKQLLQDVTDLQQPAHPQLITYQDAFAIGSAGSPEWLLLRPFIPGQSLQAFWQEGRTCTEAQAQQLATALLTLLESLHQHHPPIIHAALTTGNVVMSPDRRPHLVDFVCPSLLSHQPPTFLAPVASPTDAPAPRHRSLVPATDLYDLGTLLITLITGRLLPNLPHDGTRIDLNAVVDLSPTFVDWLTWLTEAHPDRRPPSATVAREALLPSGKLE